jgi:hypothetical protein
MEKRIVLWAVALIFVVACISGCAEKAQKSCTGEASKGPAIEQNGVWIWDGKEILVGFSHNTFKEKKGHNSTSPGRSVLARSLDGGKTWKLEDPENFVGDDGAATPSPGRINFAHPGFAMRLHRSGGIRFFISYDRGRKWQGPYSFGDLMSHPEFEGLENTARTDYIVNGKKDCFIFMSARKPDTGTRDRALCARTTDGGKTFKFVSWINHEEVGTVRGAMPSTVRISKRKLVVANTPTNGWMFLFLIIMGKAGSF